MDKEIRKHSSHTLKKAMTELLPQHGGIVYAAAKTLSKQLSKLYKEAGKTWIAPSAESIRRQHYKWMKTDEKYFEAFRTAEDIALDISESELQKQIKGGNITAIIFHLKTKGKERGYVERIEQKFDELPDVHIHTAGHNFDSMLDGREAEKDG